MARIKHIAIMTEDPAALADYYADVFGMKVTGNSSQGAVWITDGYMDVALIPLRNGANLKPGINHWGFTLDDEEEKTAVTEKMGKYGIEVRHPPIDRPYVEIKGRDIAGNSFDISTSAVAVEGEGGVADKPVGAGARAQ